MQKNKLLALILTLCMMLTTVGSLGIVNAEGEITLTATYDIGQGSSFSLPGGTVVNTSNIGYQILSETAEGITKYYRVNVGAYQNLISENFENLQVGVDPDNKAAGGFSIYCNNTTIPTVDVAYESETSGNKVLQLGSDNTNWNTSKEFIGLSLGDNKIYTGSFQFSGKLKFNSYIKDSSVFVNITNNRMGYTTDHSLGGLYFYQNEEGYVNVRNTKGSTTSGENVKNYSFSNTAGTWIDFKAVFDLSSKTYDIYINDMSTPLISDCVYNGTVTDIQALTVISRDSIDNKIQIDELKIEKLVYPSAITQNSFEQSVYRGTTSGNVTVPVTMSDGTTQNFTAAYTLTSEQAATAGTYTVNTAIPGFSEAIKVNVTVMDSAAPNKTINTYVGANYEFPTAIDSANVTWKNYSGIVVTKADTALMGRKVYTGTLADGRTITYIVNVGEYTEKLKDDMSAHTSTTDATVGIETVNPGTNDGFTLSMVNSTSFKNSATVKTSGTNTYLNVNAKTDTGNVSTPVGNATWTVKDSFNGDYKVSYDIKLENAVGDSTKSYYPYRFILYDPADNMIATTGLYPTAQYLAMRGQKISGSLSPAYIQDRVNWTGTDSSRSSDWMTVDILVHLNEKTYDILVNDIPTHTGLAFETNTSGALGRVKFDCRQNVTECDAMIDNVTISTYNCVAEEFEDGLDIVTAVGDSTPLVPLNLSNGSSKYFEVTLPCDVSKIAEFENVSAAIAGFDGKINASVRVANYHVNGVNLMVGNEYVTYPVKGGKLDSVTLTKLTDASAETMVVAFCSKDSSIKGIKVVDISALVKDKATQVPVALDFPENTQTGDYIRIFVFDSMSTIKPMDLVTDLIFDYTTAPTVYIAGASMEQTYSRTENPSQWPKTGIGQALPEYISDDVSVVNYAQSGYASHMFINDGFWTRILNNLKTGDYVIVVFGGNDQVKCTDETHPDGCAFKSNTRYFIESVREKGANIIILSPFARRLEGLEGNPKYDSTSHKHITTAKEICEELNVTFIDMAARTSEYLQSLDNVETTDVNEAIEESEKMYMVDLIKNMNIYKAQTLWETSRYNPDGTVKDTAYTTDNTHLTIYGANIYAQLLAENIKELDIQLSKFVNNTDTTINYPAFDLE